MKSQAVRLVDVGLLGPFMIIAGWWLLQGRTAPLAGMALMGAGGATIGYNWANYEKVRALENRQAPASQLAGITPRCRCTRTNGLL